MANLHYYNGQWLSDNELTISAFDLSVLRGFGVFDFLRTYNGRPFRIDDHMARFQRSADLLEIPIPKTTDELKQLISEGIERNRGQELGVRLVLTGGVSEDSITPGKPSLLILFRPIPPVPQHFYDEGVKVITWQVPRQLAEVKSLNYLQGVKAMRHAAKLDAVEALYTDDEDNSAKLYEGVTSNFFAVKDGLLITPEEGILHGITRKTVLELAADLGIEHEKQIIQRSEIPDFDEAFFTVSTKGIIPIVQIDDHKIGSGKPGPVTQKIMQSFRELTSNN